MHKKKKKGNRDTRHFEELFIENIVAKEKEKILGRRKNATELLKWPQLKTSENINT